MTNCQLVPPEYCEGKFIEILIEEKKNDLALKLQKRIVVENMRNEKEKLLLARLLVTFDQSGSLDPRDTLKDLLKSDSLHIRSVTCELCTEWAANVESRLVWFSYLSAEGKIVHVKSIAETNSKKAIEKLLQYSSYKPLSPEFIQFGINLCNHSDGLFKNEKFVFAENCSKQLPSSESFYELLTIAQADQLDQLGAILTRAKGSLNGPEYERLHQLWQTKK